jgi:menaquinone-dependent protoporphyrinogen oxidase
MKPVLVVYATREGHARNVAEHVAGTVRARGVAVDVIDAAHVPRGLDVSRYGGAILAGSVHLGKHERELVTFAKAHHADLDRLQTAFLSVSLTEAGVEDRTAPFDRRAKAAEDVKAMVDSFLHETGLHPSRVWPVAGALTFSEYGAVKRLVMKRIARAAGEKDTTHDHDLTDWAGLDGFVRAMAGEMEHASAPAS